MTIAEELAALPVFGSLSAQEIKAVAPLFVLRTFHKDAIVASEGDRVDDFYFIISGNVQAFWRDEEGHMLKLGIDEPGMHFPDQAMTGEPTLVSHVVVSELRVASIRRADLMAVFERHPQVAAAMLMNVVARLRRLIKRSKMLTMEDVYGRIVKLILSNTTDGRHVAERLTHAEIGHRVGATREMVGRVLRDLARGGYVEVDDGRITILKKLPSHW